MWVCCAWGLGSRPGGTRSSTGKVHTNGTGPRRTRGCLMGTGGQRGGEVVAARAELSLAPLWDPPRVRTGPPAGGSVCETQRPNLKESSAAPSRPHPVSITPGGNHRSYLQRRSALFTKRQGPVEEITLPCTPLSVPRGGHVLFLRTRRLAGCPVPTR